MFSHFYHCSWKLFDAASISEISFLFFSESPNGLRDKFQKDSQNRASIYGKRSEHTLLIICERHKKYPKKDQISALYFLWRIIRNRCRNIPLFSTKHPCAVLFIHSTYTRWQLHSCICVFCFFYLLCRYVMLDKSTYIQLMITVSRTLDLELTTACLCSNLSHNKLQAHKVRSWCKCTHTHTNMHGPQQMEASWRGSLL